MSPRRNWDSPNPLSPASVPLPPANWAHFFRQGDAWGRNEENNHNFDSEPSCRAKFLGGPVPQPYAGVDLIPLSWNYELGYRPLGQTICGLL